MGFSKEIKIISSWYHCSVETKVMSGWSRVRVGYCRGGILSGRGIVEVEYCRGGGGVLG